MTKVTNRVLRSQIEPVVTETFNVSSVGRPRPNVNVNNKYSVDVARHLNDRVACRQLALSV